MPSPEVWTMSLLAIARINQWIGIDTAILTDDSDIELNIDSVSIERFYSGGGNDKIEGGEKDEVISRGRGNDTLKGGSGDDTYVFNRGDGRML